MTNQLHENARQRPSTTWRSRLMALFTAALLVQAGTANGAEPGNCRDCKTTARLTLQAALAGAKADYLLEVARASTLSSEAQKEAREQAREDLKEAREEVRDQHEARLELCEKLEECRYQPTINPADFLTPAQVAANPNSFMPLVPGTTRRYRGQTDEGVETVAVTVTHDKRVILGVTCTVVRDIASLDGEIIEDTEDWFAQDTSGNVWYFGERSFNIEDGEISDLEGSWEAGVDGARPGIVMPANPVVGQVYRQEFLLGEAEDAAEVLALNESVTVPFGTFNDCLKTADFTPLEPDALEHKFYAPGVGLLLELSPESGERIELIAVEPN